jgi:SAM-dependent methyltransferase
MHALEVPTDDTVAFIEAQLKPGARILEVGCGDGEVAFALSQKGFRVTAIDSDPERVARAQKTSVRAVVASWPDFDAGSVDAIVFTRSLHHMDRLSESIQRVRSSLAPNGLLLIDDFAVESANEGTLNWFRDLMRSAPFAAVAQPHPDSFAIKLLGSANPMETFRDHHVAHEVHPFALMRKLIGEQFPFCAVQEVPYLYRYFASSVAETNDSSKLVREFLNREIEAAETGKISLIGRQIVAGL